MSQGGIEEPFSIATLPKLLNEEYGQIRAAAVHSLNASKKRKRHEVVVSVDGESANIYNVQTQTVTSSYALPPQTYIAAPPCSVHIRKPKSQQIERRTYLVVRDTPQDKRQRLVGLVEDSGKKAVEPKAILRREHRIRPGEIVNLSVLQPSSSSFEETLTSGILVTYRNGGIDYVNDDLSSTIWEYTAPADDHVTVEYATVTDSVTASKGLLKQRDDVLAAIGSFRNESSDRAQIPILCQLVRVGENRELRCFSIKHYTKHAPRLSGPGLTEIMRYTLPGSKRNTTYELHAASGTLYEHHAQNLKLFDITGLTPRIMIELSKKVTPVHRFVRISSSCVFIISDTMAVVYETKFGSILGSLQLSQNSAQNVGPSLDPGVVSASRRLEPVTSLSDLGLIVAISGNDLVALQVSEATSNSKQKKTQPSVLADVLGKGDRIAGTGIIKYAASQAKFDEWKRRVDRLISVDDIEALDALVAQDLNIRLAHRTDDTNGNGPGNVYTNGHIEEEPELWDLPPSTYDPLHMDARKATYLLAKMFAWRPYSHENFSETHRLEIVFKSRNILRWLARIGYLAPSHIEREVPMPMERDGFRSKVRAGDIMSAVEQIDQGFLLTCDLMALPIHWDLAEVMQGLRLLIQSLEDPMLPTNEDIIMSDVDVETKIEAQEAAANRELQRLVSVVEDGPLQRSEALRRLIARLQAFPMRDIKKSMRSVLSQNQLIFLLRVLQVELHEGGWTSLYVRTDEDETEQDELDDLEDAQIVADSSHNICTIANLLDCTIDAIGTSGWLIGLSGEPELSDVLIQRLRMQISAAVTGCLEANNVNTYLSELRRTTTQSQRAGKRKRDTTMDSLDVSLQETMLPLGGNVAPPTVKSRGKKKQYNAEIDRVAKYTFERLRW